MRIVELILDEDQEIGIEAISVVENPAIEEDFIALKDHKVSFQSVDNDKRLLIGPALIPDKKIIRLNADNEAYYIYFSKDTVRQASELFLTNNKQNNSTLEHEVDITGLSVVESWIIEDAVKDKSRKYGMNLPIGTWMVSVKVKNEQIWQEYVKSGAVKGFSIEGFFSDNDNSVESKSSEDYDNLSKVYDIEDLILSYEKVELETYSDYPKAAKNNAKRAIKYKKENGSSCGTQVGWTRASQLASGEALSRSTIARMASFKRHQQNKDVPYSEGCGGIMWDCWGGSAGINWAISKLAKIDKKKK